MREGQSDLDAACGDARNPHIAKVADDAPGVATVVTMTAPVLTLRMRTGVVSPATATSPERTAYNPTAVAQLPQLPCHSTALVPNPVWANR